ncbi:hypothetical protein CAEBREN_08224 [Caenorhabditis brenneri]|uniref:Sdz-33 F-box domain-containing protein n=1 Tax=Caenorhabditis brenneri TaxID=135651 RepID=G0N0A3_CAEBE|nr:hypothetical protein CAEBREN_08224 [Caenorhabditis brenneri]
MPPTFPLLRLPIDERLAILRQMEMNHLYSFGGMPPTFPLLRLPNDERLAVLRQMESSHLDHGLTFGGHGSFYDLDSVYEHFKNPVHLDLHSSGNADYDNRVLTMFIPKTAMSLDLEIFKNARLPKHILVQNYDSFNCHGNYQVKNQKFPFNALLCSNSQEITTTASGFSVKD